MRSRRKKELDNNLARKYKEKKTVKNKCESRFSKTNSCHTK
jgi:hypothetical protein